MNFFSFNFFKKNTSPNPRKDTVVFKKIKALSKEHKLLSFFHCKIYHHTQIHTIPCLLLDPLRGLYVCEVKEWSFEELQHARVEKSQDITTPSKNSLAFDYMQSIIRKKYNELIHNDGVELFKFLILENITTHQYEQLEHDVQQYLPADKIIFQDSTKTEILQKLQGVSEEKNDLPFIDTILGNLLVQYTIIENNTLHFCTQEQRAFLDIQLDSLNKLYGEHKSGKTSLLLLKAFVHLLEHPEEKVAIIKPTLLSKDLLQKRFLTLIEHAIVEINLNNIEFLTPLELLNQHAKKSKLTPIDNSEIVQLDKRFLTKHFEIAEMVLCDDSALMPQKFIEYLLYQQKKKKLLICVEKEEEASIFLKTAYQLPSVSFMQTNTQAKALQLLAKLCHETTVEKTIVISNALSREKLHEDLTSYLACSFSFSDGDKNLINQNLERLLLATYNDFLDINVEYAIVMDLCFSNKFLLQKALTLASKHCYVLYEEECYELNQLKEYFESNQN